MGYDPHRTWTLFTATGSFDSDRMLRTRLCSAAAGGVILREAKRRIALCDHANAVLRKLEVMITAMLNAGAVAVPIDSVSRRQRYHTVAVETLHDHTAPRLGLVHSDGGHRVYVFPVQGGAPLYMLEEREAPRPEALKEPFPKKLRSFSDSIADTDIRCDARGLRRLHVREGTVTDLPNGRCQRLQRWRCRLIPARHSLILKGTTLIREPFAISTTEREKYRTS